MRGVLDWYRCSPDWGISLRGGCRNATDLPTIVSDSQPEAARIDLALVARVRFNGDRAAFSLLVHRHQGAVRAQLRRLVGADHSWADDLAQETFLQAWRRLEQFRGQARFSTWLHSVAYMIFLQAARRRKVAANYVADHHESTHDESRQQALTTDLFNAMRQLTEGEQLALLHCYQLDLTHDEAAFVLRVPAGTVKTNIARGKAKLKAHLAAWSPGY
jgi:RNA polymerase sigma factor (sigma-70 family)